MMNIAMTCNDNDDDTLKINDDTSIADHTNDIRISMSPTNKMQLMYPSNSNDPCFDWKRPCFGGVVLQK